MKLNLSFFQPTVKNAVSTVSTVRPADDEGARHNRKKNSAVSAVRKKPDKPENLTGLTGEKNERLCVKPANNPDLTGLTGITAKNTTTENFLQAKQPETSAKLRTAGAIQDGPAMPEHASDETNATQAMRTPILNGDAITLINRAVELEYYAKQQGAKFAAHEIGRLLAVVDAAGDQTNFDIAMEALRTAINDKTYFTTGGIGQQPLALLLTGEMGLKRNCTPTAEGLCGRGSWLV